MAVVKCPKCNSSLEKIKIISQRSFGHECEALCLCLNCLAGFEYWKMFVEEKREYIDLYRTIKY